MLSINEAIRLVCWLSFARSYPSWLDRVSCRNGTSCVDPIHHPPLARGSKAGALGLRRDFAATAFLPLSSHANWRAWSRFLATSASSLGCRIGVMSASSAPYSPRRDSSSIVPGATTMAASENAVVRWCPISMPRDAPPRWEHQFRCHGIVIKGSSNSCCSLVTDGRGKIIFLSSITYFPKHS